MKNTHQPDMMRVSLGTSAIQHRVQREGEGLGKISPKKGLILFSQIKNSGDHTEQSKSEREKQILYMNTYMWDLGKWDR